MRILVTGASGFVGSQLTPKLLAAGHDVVALARDPAQVERAIESRADVDDVQVYAGDLLTGAGLGQALEGVEVAYYLVHSMETRSGERQRQGDVYGMAFPARDRLAAENFAGAAASAGVRRVVYLGGPVRSWSTSGARAASSRHLTSREAVEHILRSRVSDTVVLRASIVIGARSRSFRLLVHLVERMPVLMLPAWRSYRTRPIDERDIVAMLAAAGTDEEIASDTFDVGGPDTLGYGEMIERIAHHMLVARPAIGLSLSATPVTARVVTAIAQEDPELTIALMESLQGDLLPGGLDGTAHLRAAQLLGIDLHSFDSAVEHALREWEETEPLAAR
jgi:uncharacterized protein YbjT (DUF2867 family)